METTLDSTEPVIVKCILEPFPRQMPEGMFDPMPSVKVRFSNGVEKSLYEFFFPDEITIDSTELLGLTEKDAFNLKTEKDIQYLQS